MANESKPSIDSNSAKRRLLFCLLLVALLSLLTVITSCQQEGSSHEPTLAPTAPPATVATGSASQKDPATPAAQATAAVTSTTATKPVAELAGERAGALVQVDLESQVGVLLDEVPEPMRARVVTAILDQPESIWIERARRQVQLTLRRLDFRNFFYDNKGQLPLPPAEVWSFRFDDAGPIRQTVQGHDLIVWNYTFSSTLLTDPDSTAAAEPALADTGGVWEEPFVLPIDPELLLQRTGNACINESGFPPNSFDSENAWVFYDHTCLATSGGPTRCHRVRLPNESCLEALETRIGSVETAVRFERLAWDLDLADKVRVGSVTQEDVPDLLVVADDLEKNRIIYRYFPGDSCALAEGCVGSSGWRRLLQFNATVHNVGSQALEVGPVVSEDPDHNVFKYSACHDHFHFNNYGDFFLDAGEEATASKQAFCVESTSRFSNNEHSPLTHPYTCRFQGVQAGWVDEYIAGLDCQWIDITDVVTGTEPATAELTFNANPDQFLCEGTAVTDEEGNVQWEDSGFTTEDGDTIERPQCDFVSDWDANNSASLEVEIPAKGSFVTAPCDRNQVGPRRNCGFTERADDLTCTPGSTVELSCRVDEAAMPQVLRVCETSAVLGTGVACTYLDALANITVGDGADDNEAEVSFTCPGPRDQEEPGGAYVFYTAAVWPEDEPQPVTCTTQ